jgi:chromate reductase
VEFTLADLSQIPLFNQDLEDPYPAAVVQLKELLSRADAVVIASPEYNLSYTAVLKNALEWVSRRNLQTNLAGKPVALVGVSAIASSISQSHLRDVLWALNMNVLNRPIASVAYPHEKFDQEGRLTDQTTRDLIGQVRDALLEAVKK